MRVDPIKFVLAAGAAAIAFSPIAVGAAAAQDDYDYAPPPPPPSQQQQQGDDSGYQNNYPQQQQQPDDRYDQNGYQQQPNGNYQNNGNYPPNGSYQGQYQGAPGQYDDQGDQAYAAPPPPPPGYDGRQLPPPPPGYNGPDYDQAWTQQDDVYARNAEDWARRYCVKSGGNVGAGAAIGGILGAIIGSGLGGRHDHGGGAIAGAVVGAAGGAAIASSSQGETSPGCPPGYVVRHDAVAFNYAPTDYYYAAPDWYRPWVFIDNSWVYRPYPYHAYFYRHYRGPWHGGRGRGYYGHRGHGNWRH